MPFRLGREGFQGRAKIQFTTSMSMPFRIYQACKATGVISNTVYCQIALCEKLSKDLGIPLDELLDELPPPRGAATHVFDPAVNSQNRATNIREDPTGGRYMIGPANTNEEVR